VFFGYNPQEMTVDASEGQLDHVLIQPPA